MAGARDGAHPSVVACPARLRGKGDTLGGGDDPIPAALTLVHRSLQHGSPPSPGLPPGRARSYLRQCHRLSGVLLCAFPDSRAPQICRLWLNPQARHPLPPALIRSLERP